MLSHERAGALGTEVTVTGIEQRRAWAEGHLPPVEHVRQRLWSIPVPIPESPLRYVTSYLVDLGDGVALIDTGWPDEQAWDSLQAGIAVTGYNISDVRVVLVTHGHPDHHGLSSRVREHSGAWIGMHAAEAEFLVRGPGPDHVAEKAATWLLARGTEADEANQIGEAVGGWAATLRLVQPDRIIDDCEAPLPGSGITAVWTPGHTPGHLCFADGDNDVILTGDHVLPRITPNISSGLGDGDDPGITSMLDDYLRSLGWIEQYTHLEVLPAHEYRFSGLQERITALRAHHKARLDEICAAIAQQPGSSTLDIASRLTWSRAWSENIGEVRQAALGETYAHLLHLEREGVTVNRSDDVDRWFLA